MWTTRGQLSKTYSKRPKPLKIQKALTKNDDEQSAEFRSLKADLKKLQAENENLNRLS